MNTTFKSAWIATVLASFVVACQEPSTTSSDSAAVTVAIPALANAAATNATTPRSLDGVPLQVNRVVIAVVAGDQEVASGDVYANGGSLTLAVPTDIDLNVNGTAYAGETITHHGGTTIPGLRPGQKASVSFAMTVVAGLGPVTIVGPTRIDVTLTGQAGNGRSNRAQFSTDKTRVAFVSASTNLARNDTNGFKDLFVKNLTTGDLRNVHTDSQGNAASTATSATAAFGVSDFRVSGDGSTVYFVSDADNLVSGDDNEQPDIFAKNIDSGAITRVFALPKKLVVNAADPASVLEGKMFGIDLSQDSTRLVFASGNRNTSSDGRGIYLFDTRTGSLRFIGPGVRPVISADGSTLAWTNFAADPVSGLSRDVLYHYSIATQTRKEMFTAPLPANGKSTFVNGAALSARGDYLVYSLLSVQTNSATTTSTYESDGPFRYNDENGETARVGADASGVALPTSQTLVELGTSTATAGGAAGPAIPSGASFEFELSLRDAAASSDTGFVTFSDGKRLLVKDTRDGRLSTLNQAGVNPSLSPDGAFIAYTTADGALFVEPNPLLIAQSAAPEAPSGPVANRVAGQGITVTWNPVPNATGYNIYMATSPELLAGNIFNSAVQKFSNVTSPFTVNQIGPAETVYFLITSINAAGESKPSSLLKLVPSTIAPPAPPSQPAFADSDSIELLWSVVDGATSYNIYIASDASVNKDNYASFGGQRIENATSPHVVSNLPDRAHNWYFVVTAVNSGGESASSPPANLAARLPSVLAAPVVSTVDSRGMTTITWTPDNSAISYNVYVANDATLTKDNYTNLGGQRIANVSSPYVFGPVDVAKDYYFVVTGVNLAGESASSSAAKLAAPPSPSVGTTGPSYNGQASTCYAGSFGTVTLSGAYPPGAASSVSIFCAGSSETTGLLVVGGWGSSQAGATNPNVVVWVGVDATSGTVNVALVGFFAGSASTNDFTLSNLYVCDPNTCGTVQVDRAQRTVTFNNTNFRLTATGTTPVVDGPIMTLNGSFRATNGPP